MLNRRRMGHVAAEFLPERLCIIRINLRVIAPTRYRNVCHAAVEQSLSQLGVRVNQDTVGSLSLAGVAGPQNRTRSAAARGLRQNDGTLCAVRHGLHAGCARQVPGTADGEQNSPAHGSCSVRIVRWIVGWKTRFSAAKFFGMMVARDGVEPPTPAFSDLVQPKLTTTYRFAGDCQTLANTCRSHRSWAGIVG